MYKGKRFLAVIPARGGSKGILHKNIIELCERPLIAYTIDAGMGSKYVDYVMVSTDDDEIASIAKHCGANVPFLRPTELASDTAKTVDVILHTITELEKLGESFDELVLLQPTQPLRTTSDIDDAIEKYYSCNCIPLVSVSEVNDNPLLIRSIESGRLKSLLDDSSTCRRQDMPIYYRVNGCIYINAVNKIDNNTSFNDNPLPFIMDRSHSVDIDELCDLALAEYYLRKKNPCEVK